MQNPYPKLCCDCVYLLGKRYMSETVADWRCAHPSNVVSRKVDLVTGAPTVVYAVNNLREMRSVLLVGACGAEGKLFEQYQQPQVSQYKVPAPPTAPAPASKRPTLSKLTMDDL